MLRNTDRRLTFTVTGHPQHWQKHRVRVQREKDFKSQAVTAEEAAVSIAALSLFPMACRVPTDLSLLPAHVCRRCQTAWRWPVAWRYRCLRARCLH
jgi:hypothetical protein